MLFPKLWPTARHLNRVLSTPRSGPKLQPHGAPPGARGVPGEGGAAPGRSVARNGQKWPLAEKRASTARPSRRLFRAPRGSRAPPGVPRPPPGRGGGRCPGRTPDWGSSWNWRAPHVYWAKSWFPIIFALPPFFRRPCPSTFRPGVGEGGGPGGAGGRDFWGAGGSSATMKKTPVGTVWTANIGPFRPCGERSEPLV